MDENDKSLIKKLDKKTDLLERKPSTAATVQHRVPFPEYITATVRGRGHNVVKAIMMLLQGYEKRAFRLTYDHYGLEASVNYENGEFHSLILKGTGSRGERMEDRLALKLVPKESKHKGKVTLHILLTVDGWDQRGPKPGYTEREVPRLLRAALRNHQAWVDNHEIVCRVLRLYIDGERISHYSVFDEVSREFTPAYELPVDHEDMEECLEKEINDACNYHLPVQGLVISDEDPNDPDAFPETHFSYRSLRHDH